MAYSLTFRSCTVNPYLTEKHTFTDHFLGLYTIFKDENPGIVEIGISRGVFLFYS